MPALPKAFPAGKDPCAPARDSWRGLGLWLSRLPRDRTRRVELLYQGCWSACAAPCVLPLREAPGGGSPGGSRCHAVRVPELGRTRCPIQLPPARRHSRSSLPRAPGGSPWPARPRYLDSGRWRKGRGGGSSKKGGRLDSGSRKRAGLAGLNAASLATSCFTWHRCPPPARHLLFPQPCPTPRVPAGDLRWERPRQPRPKPHHDRDRRERSTVPTAAGRGGSPWKPLWGRRRAPDCWAARADRTATACVPSPPSPQINLPAAFCHLGSRSSLSAIVT